MMAGDGVDFTPDDLTSPSPFRLWAKRALGAETAHFNGSPSRWEPLFDADLLDRVLARQSERWFAGSHLVKLPFYVNRDGAVIPPSSYMGRTDGGLRLETTKLREIMTKGATAVIQGLDDYSPPLHTLMGGLAQAAGGSVTGEGFQSSHHGSDFTLHCCLTDVFVLQVAGSKRFHFFGQPVDWPYPLAMRREFQEPVGDSASDVVTTAPGDVLYIPRGVHHKVTTLDHPSRHVRICLVRPTGVDVLQWLVERSIDHSAFARRDLPFEPIPADTEDYVSALLREVTRLLTADSLGMFFP